MTGSLAQPAAGVGRWHLRIEFLTGRAPASIAFVLVLAFLALGARLVDVGARDLGIVGLFSTDEQLAGQLVRAMVRSGNLGLSHFFSYGPLDLYIARALLWPYSVFRPVSDEAIVVALRLVSLAAGAGCLCATYALGRRLWNAWVGAAAAGILACSATLLAWSTTAHPDMLQVLWLLLGLFAASRLAEGSFGGRFGGTALLLLGTVCAALAFLTKYSGELLLPVLWLADILSRMNAGTESSPRRRSSQLLSMVADVGLSAILFVLLLAALDPSAVGERRSFLYQMTLEAGLAHGGHLLQASFSPGGWIRTLASAEAMGPAGLLLGVAGLIAWGSADLRALFRRPLPGAPLRRLPLEAFTAGYLVFLVVWIGDNQARYALPALPGLSLMAAAAIVWITQRFRPWTLMVAVGMVVATVLPLVSSVAAYERTQADRMHNPAVANRIAGGQWLSANIPVSTPILADAYSYVPPAFANVTQSFGLTHGLVESIRPAVIVTDASIRNRFLDPAVADQYVGGSAAYRDTATTYAELESGRLPCYAALKRFGPVGIYGRTAGC